MAERNEVLAEASGLRTSDLTTKDTATESIDMSNRTSSLNLPSELVSEIMALATRGQPDSQRRYAFPSTLCCVSRSWNTIARSTTELWSLILLVEQSMPHVASRLQRSGNVPLTVIVYESGGWSDKGISWGPGNCVLKAARRWESLTMKAFQIDLYLSCLPPTLPLLSKLVLQTEQEPEEDLMFDLISPRLTMVHLIHTTIFWDHSGSTFTNLTDFSMSGYDNMLSISTELLMGHIRKCPLLRRLEIRDLEYDFITDQAFQALISRTVDLPHLVDLTLGGAYLSEIWPILITLRAPRLKQLSLSLFTHWDIDPPGYYNLEHVALNFPELETLTFKDATLDPHETVHLLRPLPALRHLWMIRTPNTFLQFDEEVDRRTMQQIFQPIFHDPSLNHLASSLLTLHTNGLPIQMVLEGVKELSLQKDSPLPTLFLENFGQGETELEEKLTALRDLVDVKQVGVKED